MSSASASAPASGAAAAAAAAAGFFGAGAAPAAPAAAGAAAAFLPVDEQSQAAVNPASFASAGRGPLVGWKVPAPRVHVSSGVGGPPANALSHPAAASAQKVKLVQSGLASQRAAQASCLECRFGFFVFLFFRGSGEVEKRKEKKRRSSDASWRELASMMLWLHQFQLFRVSLSRSVVPCPSRRASRRCIAKQSRSRHLSSRRRRSR